LLRNLSVSCQRAVRLSIIRDVLDPLFQDLCTQQQQQQQQQMLLLFIGKLTPLLFSHPVVVGCVTNVSAKIVASVFREQISSSKISAIQPTDTRRKNFKQDKY
jgi:hypothetical protein